MMGIRKREEPIQVREKRFGYFPQRFHWHGREYVVNRVERCWTIKRKRWGGRVERLCFRVHCSESFAAGRSPADAATQRGKGEGTYDVFQDLIGNTWHIQQASPN
jgi:uncharacterized protein DUF6504